MANVPHLLVQRLPLLLLISFLAAAAAFTLARALPRDHELHFSYLVSLSQREAAPDFRFDGYYALQATDLFATTLAQWIQTPEVIFAAHQEAGLAPATNDPRTIRRQVTAEKTAPQLVEVTVRAGQSLRARQLAAGLTVVMDRNIAQYHQEGIPALTFRAVPTTPWVGIPAVSTSIIAVATFVFVLFLGINIVLLIESLRENRH